MRLRRGPELSPSRIRGPRPRATVGAFRVVDSRDLATGSADARNGDLAHLRELKLIKVVGPQFRDGERAVAVTLTKEGRALLERHQRTRDDEPRQAFYCDVAKPRELRHDAQLYRAYEEAAKRLQDRGDRIQRVVLDYELKREYQRFLQANNRGKRLSSGRPDRTPAEIAEWARQHGLPSDRGHVQFPDVRIEYERPDGRPAHEDIELATEHYNSRQMAGKRSSGFTICRGASSHGSSSPFDPHTAEYRGRSAPMTFAMPFDDRVAAVTAFGFTPRQARFLTTVMLHSGVCMPRHYTKFAGIAFGHNTRDFFAKLTREKLATAYACWRRQGTYFHVHHKALYRAIWEPDNRHRRRPTIPRTAERLMLLDIVLDHPEMDWLATEADKARHFAERYDVPREDMPSLVFEQGGSKTVRYFPDKLPIGQDSLGRLLFVYLVTDPNPDAVRRFMQRHRPLFRRVPRWTLGLFFPGHLAGAEGRVRGAVMESFGEPLSPSVREEFEWFCHTRRALEQGHRTAAAVDQVRYSRARRAFRSPSFYAAYRAWLKQGDSAFWDLMMPGLRDKLQCDLVRIETHVLPHRYLNVASAAMTA